MADADKGGAYLDKRLASRPRLVSARDKLDALFELWDKGLPPGFKTGWPSVDALYTVVPGQLTVVTGWPSSGKSEWVDALLINLSRQSWRLAYYSPENMPVELHQAKLIEKLAGKPFGEGLLERVARDEITEYADEISERFRFVEPIEGALSARDVLDATVEYLADHDGPRGLVIDPWNELEHWRPSNMNESEYVSATLSEIRQWGRKHKVHVWIVAHPQKVRREDGGVLPVAKPDMISGSQHWWNKADCCISVYRDFAKLDKKTVDIYIHKCRFKHVGKIGMTSLNYDRATGIYEEQDVAMRVVTA